MGGRLKRLRCALLRVVPDCLTQAQAIAFVMFLSFFPALLLGLGLMSLLRLSGNPVQALPAGLRAVLPETGTRMVADFLARLNGRPERLIGLGLIGTLLLGGQTMASYLDAFALVWRHQQRVRHLARLRRGLLMLALTVLPWMVTILLSMLGRELRSWMATRFGGGLLMNLAWGVFYQSLALLAGWLTLGIMYRLGQPPHPGRPYRMPGAAVATLLWWLLNVSFSLYVRHVPYSLVYGSLATVIGLMVWMYFVALVVLIGAAYNAEMAEAEQASRVRACTSERSSVRA